MPGIQISIRVHPGLPVAPVAVTTKSVRRLPQFAQRNRWTSGTARVDQALQIGIAPMAAGLAPHQDADIAGAQRGSWRRQFVVVGAHSLDLGLAR